MGGTSQQSWHHPLLDRPHSATTNSRSFMKTTYSIWPSACPYFVSGTQLSSETFTVSDTYPDSTIKRENELLNWLIESFQPERGTPQCCYSCVHRSHPTVEGHPNSVH